MLFKFIKPGLPDWCSIFLKNKSRIVPKFLYWHLSASFRIWILNWNFSTWLSYVLKISNNLTGSNQFLFRKYFLTLVTEKICQNHYLVYLCTWNNKCRKSKYFSSQISDINKYTQVWKRNKTWKSIWWSVYIFEKERII